MSSKTKKPKFCKCGDKLEDHKKKPDKRFSPVGFCRKCPCSRYMHRERPNKEDKATLIIFPISFVLMAFLLILALSDFYSLPEEDLNKEIAFTVRDIVDLFGLVIFVFLIWLGAILVVEPIDCFLKVKKRIAWPLKDNEQIKNDE